MRLVHIADIHLDTSFASEGIPPEIGSVLRDSMRKCLTGIFDDAKTWPADAILVAGDFFEHEYVSYSTIRFLDEILEGVAPIPVLISPGNRDPLRKDSPYTLDPWPSNVHIFQSPEWQTIEIPSLSLVVHGYAFDDHHISRNPFQFIPKIVSDGRVNIVLCHATEVAHVPHGAKIQAPMDAAVMPAGLSYCALGHFHQLMDASALGSPPVWYPGVPHPFRFSQACGTYLKVTIEDDRTEIEQAPTRTPVFSLEELVVQHEQTIADIAGEVRRRATDKVLSLVVSGTVGPSVKEEIIAALAELRACGVSAFASDWITSCHPDYAEFESRSDMIGDFCVSLSEEIKDAPRENHAMLMRARDIGLSALSTPVGSAKCSGGSD